MKITLKYIAICLVFLFSCSNERIITGQIEGIPEIFPDYTEVTIPYNIAPLNFSLQSYTASNALAIIEGNGYSFEIKAQKGQFSIPIGKWKKLLSLNKGKQIKVTILKKNKEKWEAYEPFHMLVASEPIDNYLVYRLIEPGYSLWNEMGIYQRNLETFEETPIYENKLTNYNCVNCHSFCMQDPDQMLFHMRSAYGGTILLKDKQLNFLDTKTDKTISSLAYPSWHPSGKYIAFSVNETTQGFHPEQRVEVYDKASDVVIYDIDEKTILSSPLIFKKDNFETFPTFSPDGTTLYYCSAPACPMPDSINQLKYNLCSISFNPETKTFGNKIDTMHNATLNGKSVSFPRLSPDGNFLMCTLSGYGTFPIWHKDADLYMIDINKGEGFYPDNVNSGETDSYHSWSSNSRWIVFSSRRMDGLYTRPFFTYIDKNGKSSKPFILPQMDTDFYASLMKSYNIPELITGKVKIRSSRIMDKAKHNGGGQSVQFRME